MFFLMFWYPIDLNESNILFIIDNANRLQRYIFKALLVVMMVGLGNPIVRIH
jgi:hypothetical protein